MKKKIVILGSTGSIGKSLIQILKEDSNKFDVVLLTANKNYKSLLNQAKILKVKNIIITDKEKYQKMSKAHSPYGEGLASQAICKVLEEVKL